MGSSHAGPSLHGFRGRDAPTPQVSTATGCRYDHRMAKSWQYPRWRRYVMQVVMWVILAGTMGLAAAVTHYRSAALRVELGDPRARGGVTVQLPRDWLPQSVTDSRVTLFNLLDPEGEPLPRQLLVQRFAASADADLAETMLEGFALTGARLQRREELQISRRPGVLVIATHSIDPRFDRAGLRGKFVGAATMHDGEAIVIALIGAGPIDRTDVDLVRRVASSARVEAAPVEQAAD
jgi:hypothetical protein